MKIAVAALDKNPEAEVSPVFGRAPYFLLFADGEFEKALNNPFRFGGGGAGFGAAEMLADEGVIKIAAGKFGEKVLAFFEEKNVEAVVSENQTAAEIAKSFC